MTMLDRFVMIAVLALALLHAPARAQQLDQERLHGWVIRQPAHKPTTDALVVPAYFVMMCCGLSTGTQRASGILGVWDFPSLPNIVLAFMHSPSVE